jgi:hypothetical protein
MKTRFGQRVSVLLFAVAIVAAVMGLSFFVGYIVGKILL